MKKITLLLLMTLTASFLVSCSDSNSSERKSRVETSEIAESDKSDDIDDDDTNEKESSSESKQTESTAETIKPKSVKSTVLLDDGGYKITLKTPDPFEIDHYDYRENKSTAVVSYDYKLTDSWGDNKNVRINMDFEMIYSDLDSGRIKYAITVTDKDNYVLSNSSNYLTDEMSVGQKNKQVFSYSFKPGEYTIEISDPSK